MKLHSLAKTFELRLRGLNIKLLPVGLAFLTKKDYALGKVVNQD